MEFKCVDNVIEEVIKISSKYKIEKAILFGSRARGDNTITSDYDIAVFGYALSAIDKANFCNEIEEIETLKKIDVVFINNGNTIDDLIENIMRDGVVIYEQVKRKSY